MCQQCILHGLIEIARTRLRNVLTRLLSKVGKRRSVSANTLPAGMSDGVVTPCTVLEHRGVYL